MRDCTLVLVVESFSDMKDKLGKTLWAMGDARQAHICLEIFIFRNFLAQVTHNSKINRVSDDVGFYTT